MRARVRQWSPDDRGRPLAGLATDADDDWSMALLSAWAAGTDVLSFHQERLLNEGFLGTAAQPRSVVELARAVGFRPRPAVAARGVLAVTAAGPEREGLAALVPAGTAVQSVPDAGGLSQTFETTADVVARPEGNRRTVRPRTFALLDPAPDLQPGLREVRVAGQPAGVEAGARLLIAGGGFADPATVTAVETDESRDRTSLTIDIGPGAAPRPADARLHLLREAGALLAAGRTGVVAARGGVWEPVAGDLPPGAVSGLAVLDAATPKPSPTPSAGTSSSAGASTRPARTPVGGCWPTS